jgi:trk system potassium uptake protein TrkH
LSTLSFISVTVVRIGQKNRNLRPNGHTRGNEQRPMSNERFITHPGRLVVFGFVALIATGSALLALPISQTSSASGASFGEAIFTAASAVTVTGLTVVDTGTTWSPFGEIVLLVLIQVGGLGIMTLAGFVGISLNRRLRLRSGLLAGTEIGLSDFGTLRRLISDLVRFVFITEAVTALLLAGRFLLVDDHSLGRAVHLGIFHAVSAFNNAGFSILDGGLEPYVGDWFVNLVIAGAFILGGLGFPVVFEVRGSWRQAGRWSLHTKVTLATTAALLVGGTVLIGIGEWSNSATLGSLDTDERILASFFQSATARTAGFSTIPIGSLRSASLLILIPLMVVGAGSASTGGGIKVSTLAVVIKATTAELRRDARMTLFDRHISDAQQRQALALVVAALGAIGAATFVLALSDPAAGIEPMLFEAVSAFGTVGVSTGITPDLDWLGQVTIVALMFLGRVGPITFGTAVLLRPERRRYGYAEETLLVG